MELLGRVPNYTSPSNDARPLKYLNVTAWLERRVGDGWMVDEPYCCGHRFAHRSKAYGPEEFNSEHRVIRWYPEVRSVPINL